MSQHPFPTTASSSESAINPMNPNDTQQFALKRAELRDAIASDHSRYLPTELAERVGLRLERFGRAIAMVYRSFPSPMLNQVMNLGVFEPASEAVLDAIIALYHEANLPFMVQVSPATATDLQARLESRGLVRGGNLAVFRRSPTPMPEVHSDLRVERIGAEWGDALGNILARAFGAPPEAALINASLAGKPGWYCYLAFDRDTPVGMGRMFVKGNMAYMLGAGTLPEYRRRGAQAAILARRFLDAANLGCTILTMETGEELPERPNASYRNAVRAGFEPVYLEHTYIYKPTANR
jgi:hypothetical protein